MWFIGANGNAAFSTEHEYAAELTLMSGRLLTLARLGRDMQGRWSPRAFRVKVLGPLRRRYFTRDLPLEEILPQCGIVTREQVTRVDRKFFLSQLTDSQSGLAAVFNPAAHNGILPVDPFTSRAVLDVAARIAPTEWQRGGLPRGFARRAGAGRVPDEIRLRRRNGQQGRDAWYVVRHDRDDYLDRVASLARIPGLEHVDPTALRAIVSAWPWGQVQGPYWPEQIAVDRLLALADFAATAIAAPADPPRDANQSPRF
jgi:hypothetical protein